MLCYLTVNKVVYITMHIVEWSLLEWCSLVFVWGVGAKSRFVGAAAPRSLRARQTDRQTESSHYCSRVLYTPRPSAVRYVNRNPPRYCTFSPRPGSTDHYQHDTLSGMLRTTSNTAFFRSETGLIALLLFFFLFCLLGRPFSNRIGVKFGRNVVQVNTHWLTKSDFRFDLASPLI